MRRYLSPILEQFAKKKPVLLSGPRQVGKTTLAREWMKGEARSLELNWDIPEDRERVLRQVFSKSVSSLDVDCLILDEIHKYARWKSSLKGLVDRKLTMSMVVTGSARLDTYQKGGDSLLGRFEALRLHPLSLGEILRPKGTPIVPLDWLSVGHDFPKASQILDRLESRSGFPEPFHSDDSNYYRRWALKRRQLLTTQDVRDLSNIKMISLFEHLTLLLPERVGSPLSINSLREVLQTSHETVSSWIDLLDRLYFSFRLRPYSPRVSRSLLKETKLYLWDWAAVESMGHRFENLVASHLLKAAHLWSDIGLGEFDLQYLRNKEKMEIDFILTERGKPIAALEVKCSDEAISESWKAFSQVLKGIPKIQLIRTEGIDRIHPSGVRIVSAAKFLAGLP